MMKKNQMQWVVSAMLLLVATPVCGQSRYCNSYEDFVGNRWEQLDTIYLVGHSKSRQLWWGGNDYTLTSGDDAIDKKLKKDAFVVMQGDSIYLNCHNLRYQKTVFGNGFTKARRVGDQNLLFVNKIVGKEAMSGVMLGAIGGAIAASKQMKQQVCYVVSNGADKKGRIEVKLIDDELMDQLIANRADLHDEYYAEKKASKRRLATHIIPILEKAGLL